MDTLIGQGVISVISAHVHTSAWTRVYQVLFLSLVVNSKDLISLWHWRNPAVQEPSNSKAQRQVHYVCRHTHTDLFRNEMHLNNLLMQFFAFWLTQKEKRNWIPYAVTHPVYVLRGNWLWGVGSGEENTHSCEWHIPPICHKHFGLCASIRMLGNMLWGNWCSSCCFSCSCCCCG